MARSSGPFAATPADMERARDYLAQRGITYRGHSPAQAQRLGNAVARQEAAGLLPNRAAARGHGRTPEHPGRQVRQRVNPPKAVREAAPQAAGKALKAGTPRDYQRATVRGTFEHIAGRDIYGTSDANRAAAIINFLPVAGSRVEADGRVVEGGRVDIEVTYENGTTYRLFTGADHKRNGEHAIDAQVLQEKLKAAGGNMERMIFDATDSDRSDIYPPVGVPIVSYSITFYPY